MPAANRYFSFDLDKVKAAVLAEDLPFLDSAEDFLKRYGGLHLIRYKQRQNGRTQPKKLVQINLAHFDVIRTIQSLDCSWFKHYSARIDKLVTPIGMCGSEHAALMIDENGIIYGGFDGCLGKIANSPGEAILELCDRTVRGWESIPDMANDDYLKIECRVCGSGIGEECKYLPTVRCDESWRRPHTTRIDDKKEIKREEG